MVKKGIFFSIDALIAVMLILSVIIFTSVFYSAKQPNTQQVYFSSDIVQILSTVKIGEINEPGVTSLLTDSNVTDLNRTILEQTLRFQVEGSQDKARQLLNLTIANLVPDYYNMGIWIEGYDEPIFNSSQKPIHQLISSKQLVSGIEKDKKVEGLASRAILSKISERTSSAYTYFGGYEGDGNITKKIFLPNVINSIDSAYMELDAGSDFDLYINGIFSGNYTPSHVIGSDDWEINSTYFDNFKVGENTIKLSFAGETRYVGGGYFKVSYSTSELEAYQDSGVERYYFPGIDGLINVYSSFYIPGSLSAMGIYLHGESDYDVYLNIGDKVVYNHNLSGEVYLPDEELSLALNYSSLSSKTIPIRIGLIETNFTEAAGTGSEMDVVLITDLSESMNFRFDSEVEGISRDCSDPLLYDTSTKRVSLAKCLDKMFVDRVLNNTANRVALSAFYADDKPPYKARVYEESLSDNVNYLKNQIDSYSAQGGTCICCAINDAYKILSEESNSSRTKFVIVMSDGIPTHTCQSASGCEGTRTGLPSEEGLWLGWGSGCYGGLDDCGVNDCLCASQNANWSSCRVYNELNAIVHSIGFGPVDTCAMANTTLRNIADCGGGEYRSSDNATILQEIYENLAEEILSLSFKKQSVIVTGNFSKTILYSDSYILFNYNPIVSEKEYGRLPLTIETPRFDNNITEGTFYVPNNVVIYDAKITSYSSDKWTDKALIKDGGNWISFYNLSDYGDHYHLLGDPYVVNIPTDLIKGGDNLVRVSTGINPTNSTGGSPDDKVIYTAGIDIDVNYTGVFEKAEGCNWYIEFEDGTNTTVPIPVTYTGIKNCAFNATTNCGVEHSDDAVDNSVCQLFKQLDVDGNGKLFIKFGPGDLNVETYSIGNIPFMWGPALFEVRVWQ